MGAAENVLGQNISTLCVHCDVLNSYFQNNYSSWVPYPPSLLLLKCFTFTKPLNWLVFGFVNSLRRQPRW